MVLTAPRQARSEQTLQRILEACDRLLAERAFEQISMQDIAREAGVSVGNLYNRFSDKDGLVNHVIASHQQRVLATVAGALEENNDTLSTSARLDIIVREASAAIDRLRPLFASIAARLARGQNVQDNLKSNSSSIVDACTDWLLQGDPALDEDRCRFAVASMLFCLQYNLMFGAADRLFGKRFAAQLSRQAYCYICEENRDD